ncbi:MAG: tetratricopeptide repeat protein [Ignavibacteriales bacterium]|nr:tetratricopeptide repeat protein [Ignavibacteriales bacterium]
MKKYYHFPGVKSLSISILFIAVLFSGCSIWNNFTTYFNLYYNASRKFDEAEDQIKSQKKELFTLDDVKASTSNKSLTEVIEKLSRLLQFYSESTYVDDALLMIGKSFYYQANFQKALRKFNELITKYPESDLVLEAKLWIGKADFRTKMFDDGNKIFEEVKEEAAKQDEKDILLEVYKEQVSYLITIENYNEAIDNAKKLIDVSGDKEMNASIMFELGKLYLKIEQPKNAAQAFADVQNYSPDFETEFNSKIEYGKVQRQLGNVQPSLEIFEEIKSKSIYNEFLDQTDLQIGLSLIGLNRYEDAFAQLTLVDSTYRQSPSSGAAKYYLGGIMEKNYKNFDSANVYYSRVLSSSAPVELIDSAKKKNTLLNKYKDLKVSVAKNYRQLVYITNPEEFKKDSTSFAIEQAEIDSLNKINQEQRGEENIGGANTRNRRSNEKTDTKLQAKTNKLTAPIKPTISADSVHSIISKGEYDLAGLFFTEFNQIDSALYYYQNILSNHPKCPYIGRTKYAIGSCYQTLNQKEKADSLFQVVYDNFKNESIVNAAADKLKKPLINLKYDPAQEQFLIAENKLKEEKFDEALLAFNDVYKNYPKSLFAPKALFTQGWILENKLKLLDSAAVIYDTVASKFAGSQYALRIGSKLIAYKNEQKRLKAVQDSAKAKDDLKNIQPAMKDSISKVDSLKGNADRINKAINKVEIKKDSTNAKNKMIDKTDEEFMPKIQPSQADSLNKSINNDIIEENKIELPDTTKNKPNDLKIK